jgi:hypothetical protein
VARSTIVASQPSDPDLILVDPYNKCEHGDAVLFKERLTTLARWYGIYGQVNTNLFKFQ